MRASGEAPHLFDFDRKQFDSERGYLAGVDEAGRGPLAGPVVAAAVLFRRPISLPHLNDSKQVTPDRRRILFWQIAKHSLIGIGKVDEALIDEINIYQATRLAMKRAVLAMTLTPELILVDGNMRIDLPIHQSAIIRGDAQSAVIAAASIIAKVFRDEWMGYLDQLYPCYGFKRNKGYGTPDHLKQLERYGPSPVHRKSFHPCQRSGGKIPYEIIAEKEFFSDISG